MTLAAALDSGQGPWESNTIEFIFEGQLPADTPIPVSRALWRRLMSYSVIALTPLNDGSYTLQKNWTFRDPEDGEILALQAGDVLIAYRD
jgi:hypothetical protein